MGKPGFLRPKDVRHLVTSGMTIGNHGMVHRDWRRASGDELEEELVQAKGKLEELLKCGITAAACPFGSYDRRVLRALRRAAYPRVYTSDGGPTTSAAWLQPRNSVCRGQTAGDILRSLDAKQLPLLRNFKVAWKRIRFSPARLPMRSPFRGFRFAVN